MDGSNLAGNTAEIELIEVDGHIVIDLLGEVVHTREASPQVVVTINNILSKCDGDCSYSWEESLTATVTGISPTSGKETRRLFF